jgi:hypothetical protein
MTAVPLTQTAHQEAQLVLLASFSALSRRGGLDVYRAPGLNANTLSILQLRGLTCSAVERPKGGSQKTVYWLTEEGAQIAARLRREARARAGS